MGLAQLEQILESEKRDAARVKSEFGESSPFYAAALDAVEEVRSAIAAKRIPVVGPSQEYAWDRDLSEKVYDL